MSHAVIRQTIKDAFEPDCPSFSNNPSSRSAEIYPGACAKADIDEALSSQRFAIEADLLHHAVVHLLQVPINAG
ncbi:MAG: hypothetical protein Q4G66_08335, partial [bacterium]|nr:hypothetical protein [bacterium]